MLKKRKNNLHLRFLNANWKLFFVVPTITINSPPTCKIEPYILDLKKMKMSKGKWKWWLLTFLMHGREIEWWFELFWPTLRSNLSIDNSKTSNEKLTTNQNRSILTNCFDIFFSFYNFSQVYMRFHIQMQFCTWKKMLIPTLIFSS
jgi:hypothetical protein